jgi:putative ABC transport system ATP-binding protein
MGETVVRALDGASLSVMQGEMVAIMGPSGSGKSSLMNILGCLDRPTSGVYLLNGQDAGTMSDDDLARLRNGYIGFVFQSYNLLPRLNAADNVALPLMYGGQGGRKALAMQALERVGLAHRARHKPAELSGGEQQRVGIARALVKAPRLILADEPTGNLDSKSSESILAALQSLNREGITVLMVTHEAEVAAAAKRMISMRDGRVVTDERIAQRVVVAPSAPAADGQRAGEQAAKVQNATADAGRRGAAGAVA